MDMFFRADTNAIIFQLYDVVLLLGDFFHLISCTANKKYTYTIIF